MKKPARPFSQRWIKIILLSSAAVLLNCSHPSSDQKIEFSSLTEDEKRLPSNAIAAMHVKEGLEVGLFASEPMVTNPTNISVDFLGRVWVCEAYNYDVSPELEDKKGDRIIVLEDKNKDGRADKRTVFYQGTDITTPLGIMVVGNKVFVSRSPHVFVFTDTNGDLVADEKEILFTNLGKKGDHSAHSILPGPDGNLYFSTGNFAGEIKDKNGNTIVDRAGFNVNQKGEPYLGGMIMRFDEAGKKFEVLGHNFRNNYEPCVDSYGNVWQSDNDDDGNASCRINFILPYGNYGFLDEKTRASWTSNRIGIEKEVSQRHWHQNDPGVVPNVLITGAGSPAGMTIYEGSQLPEKFFGMPVHAEPYYNVVRAYINRKEGAGFSSSVEDILKSDDQWFRPVDVSTAPDGSLFVADWYDPILGGGAAGDATRGRIFRVSKNKNDYNFPSIDFSTPEDALNALTNANPETRYVAHRKLLGFGSKSIGPLERLWNSDKAVDRARAFWILATLKGDDFLKKALADHDSNIRIAAIRYVLENKENVVPYLSSLSHDPDTHVKRELITALRYASTPEAAGLWTEMATQYDGKDRWFLEALGIGSDLHADLFFQKWVTKVKIDVDAKAHQDILWRIRSSSALPFLKQIIADSHNVDSVLRFFRAFDFHEGAKKNEILLSLLDLKKDQKEFAPLILQQIDPATINKTNSALVAALKNALRETQGTLAFIDLVRKFDVVKQKGELIRLAIEKSGTEVGSAAVDQLIRFNAFSEIKKVLQKDDTIAISMLKSLQSKGSKPVIELVSEVVSEKDNATRVKQNAVLTLGSSWPGEEELLRLVQRADFAPELKPIAASVLFNVYRSSIQREAAKVLARPHTKGTQLPSIKELVASTGNAGTGKVVFEKNCVVCHRVNDTGAKFGPELTQVGSKLSNDGLYHAIIFPDEGVSHGFESSILKLNDGSEVMGIITNETNAEVELALPGGLVNKYSREQIKQIQKSDRSIMPALADAMSKQELIDLVTFLSSLKK